MYDQIKYDHDLSNRFGEKNVDDIRELLVDAAANPDYAAELDQFMVTQPITGPNVENDR